MAKSGGTTAKAGFDCTRCAAFCCSIYERVAVTPRDLRRIADELGMTLAAARRELTMLYGRERVLRRKPDPLLGRACHFLDPKTRRCGVYGARPAVCRNYPGDDRCVYYDVLEFERAQQGAPNVLPLVQIRFPKRWVRAPARAG